MLLQLSVSGNNSYLRCYKLSKSTTSRKAYWYLRYYTAEANATSCKGTGIIDATLLK